jgi:hypothetical protein
MRQGAVLTITKSCFQGGSGDFVIFVDESSDFMANMNFISPETEATFCSQSGGPRLFKEDANSDCIGSDTCNGECLVAATEETCPLTTSPPTSAPTCPPTSSPSATPSVTPTSAPVTPAAQPTGATAQLVNAAPSATTFQAGAVAGAVQNELNNISGGFQFLPGGTQQTVANVFGGGNTAFDQGTNNALNNIGAGNGIGGGNTAFNQGTNNALNNIADGAGIIPAVFFGGNRKLRGNN